MKNILIYLFGFTATLVIIMAIVNKVLKFLRFFSGSSIYSGLLSVRLSVTLCIVALRVGVQR